MEDKTQESGRERKGVRRLTGGKRDFRRWRPILAGVAAYGQHRQNRPRFAMWMQSFMEPPRCQLKRMYLSYRDTMNATRPSDEYPRSCAGRE